MKQLFCKVLVALVLASILYAGVLTYKKMDAIASDCQEKYYEHSDVRLSDAQYNYELSYADLDGNTKYLYFNKTSNADGIYKYNSDVMAEYHTEDIRIYINGNTCYIKGDNLQVITNDFYLHKIN